MSEMYVIPVSGLKEGRQEYEFEIDNDFFDRFEESEVKEGRLKANVLLDKRSTHTELYFSISGYVRVCCDRCLDMFDYPLNVQNKLLVKFGENVENIDPDILYLPAGENELDLQQHLYDFIMLALPIRKVHPNDAEGKSTCNPSMLNKLSELNVDESENDPRWDELKKLMNNN